MGLADPLVVVMEANHKTGLPYYLKRGRETFFDEERYMRRWATWQEAYDWAKENLGILPSHHLPEGAKQSNEEKFEQWKSEDRQQRLL